jgi:hypothetical protein
VGKPGKKKWLEGLEPPGLDRRLDIMANLHPEAGGGGLQGAKRTVRARNLRAKVRRPCYVCGRHRYISQSHHLIEVGRVADVLDALAIWDWSPSILGVSLCPNHHVYLHAMNRVKGKVPPDLSEALNEELSRRDWNRLIEIDDRRAEAHDRVWREVREEFLRREEEYRWSKPEQ